MSVPHGFLLIEHIPQCSSFSDCSRFSSPSILHIQEHSRRHRASKPGQHPGQERWVGPVSLPLIQILLSSFFFRSPCVVRKSNPRTCCRVVFCTTSCYTLPPHPPSCAPAGCLIPSSPEPPGTRRSWGDWLSGSGSF